MNKEIAIIGVNGKMGKWFANYFHKMGFKVKGFDTDNETVSYTHLTLPTTPYV